jgi:hypothetical protein
MGTRHIHRLWILRQADLAALTKIQRRLSEELTGLDEHRPSDFVVTL